MAELRFGSLPWKKISYDVHPVEVNPSPSASITVLPPIPWRPLPHSTNSIVIPAMHLEEKDGDIISVPNVRRKRELIPSIAREGITYKVQDGKLFGKGKKPGQEYQITDITLKEISARKIFRDMDDVEHIRYTCIVESPKWDSEKKFEVDEKDLPLLFQKVHESYHETLLFQRGADAISEIISNVFEECKDKMATSRSYAKSGWYEEDGKICYRIGNHDYYRSWEIPNVSLMKPSRWYTIFLDGHAFLKVGHNGREITTLYLYSHMGYSLFFFRKAGYTIAFVLFVKGWTGSLKTSTAVELVNPFETDVNNRIIPLNDSSWARIRELLQLAQDAISLVDDFAKTQKKLSKDGTIIIENIHRSIGNGKLPEKKKPGGVGNQSTYIRTLVIETGEDSPELGMSSLMRVILICVDRNTFDGSVLEVFQRNRSIMQLYFALYIEFLSSNVEYVVQIIQTGWKKYRPECESITAEPRLIESAMCLRIQLDLTIEFGLWCGADKYEMEKFRSESIMHIASVVRGSDSESTQIRADILFVKAIWKQVTDGTKYQLADNGNEYHKNRMSSNIGFYDRENDFIWLKMEDAHVAAQDYCRKHGLFLTDNTKIIKQALFEHGILDRPEKGWVWRWTQGGDRGRFIRLRLSKIKEIEKQEDE